MRKTLGKGKEERFPVYQPYKCEPSALDATAFSGVMEALEGQRDSPFVGRKSILKKLSKRIKKLHADREGGMVMIEAREGLGKTRILRQALTVMEKVNRDYIIKSGFSSMSSQTL